MVALVCGCGRIAFDPIGDGAIGEGKVGDGADDSTLIAYWDFEAITNGVVADVSGHGHDATVQNASLAPGFRGQGLAFAGTTTSFASVPSLAPSVLAGGDFTISLCVGAVTNLGLYDSAFYMGGTNDNEQGASVELGANSWSFTIKDGQGDPDLFVSPANETYAGTGFHCMAVKVDRGAGIAPAYIDGVQNDMDPITALDPFTLTQPTLTLGAGGSDVFLGTLDEVRIYRVALDDAAIAALHQP